MHARQCEVLLHQSHIQTLKQHCLLFVTVIRRQQVRCFDSIVYVVTPLTNTYKAWLRDKVDSTPFALPGLYQPVSLIPLTIWKACPSTTNGNEEAHRNAYREGINLTLLAGIMKGMKYDQTAMVSIDTHSAFGINTRDVQATHAFRAARAVSRKGSLSVSLTPYDHSDIHSQSRCASKACLLDKGHSMYTGRWAVIQPRIYPFIDSHPTDKPTAKQVKLAHVGTSTPRADC